MACQLILPLENITKYIIFSTSSASRDVMEEDLLYGTELFDCPPQNTTKPHHLSYRIILSLCLGLVVTSVAPNHASPAWQRCRQILVTSSETGKAIRGFKYKPHGAKHYNIHKRGHFSYWGWLERLNDGQSHHKWPAAVWRRFMLLMAMVMTRPVLVEFWA